jgi:acetyl-CoA carboxylase biotin carboxylase subunit
MGDKSEARRTMMAAGVPNVPGTEDEVDSVEQARSEAERIGYPVMIKAAAGGGGKGMRVADGPAEFEKQFTMARNEAAAAFNDPRVYLERFVDRPRHVEIQVLGDRHGNVVHLGERDCSVQRRHQKLIEEAPSPALTPELRAAMGEAAVRAAEAIGYSNAGTVEFLLASDGSFYFMEMNTRIQVEHPVTEMVTGVDLVKEQIRSAAGERLHLDAPPPMRGHSIEVRINAEDPEHDFRPSPGTITAYHAPGGPGVRVDSHVYAGYRVPPYYDSLLGKLIVWGPDREAAVARSRVALRELLVEGIETNILFHRAILEDPTFLSGGFDTNMLDRKGAAAFLAAVEPEQGA